MFEIALIGRSPEIRQTIGRHAYQMGPTTLEQIRELLAEWKTSPLRLGAIAVDTATLTPDPPEALLESQRKARVPLEQIRAGLGRARMRRVFASFRAPRGRGAPTRAEGRWRSRSCSSIWAAS